MIKQLLRVRDISDTMSFEYGTTGGYGDLGAVGSEIEARTCRSTFNVQLSAMYNYAIHLASLVLNVQSNAGCIAVHSLDVELTAGCNALNSLNVEPTLHSSSLNANSQRQRKCEGGCNRRPAYPGGGTGLMIIYVTRETTLTGSI